MNLTNLLKQMLDEFHQSTLDYANMVEHLNVLDSYKLYFQDLLKNLDAYLQSIDVHKQCLFLGTSLTSINVCQYLNSFFTRTEKKRNQKTVKYYIQTGFDSPLKEVKDPSVLESQFNIDNCVPLMSVALFQIADNALKYMPKNTSLAVVLRITDQQKRFQFKNIGPSLTDEELSEIMEPSTRGRNAQDSRAGQGLGLYETNKIVSSHSWINASFSIETQPIHDDITTLQIDDINQCVFISTLQFSRNSPVTADDVNALDLQQQDLVIHDMYQVINHLFELSSRIEKLQIVDGDYSWRATNQMYRIQLELIHDQINLCNLLFYGFDNDLAIKQISGLRFVPMNIQQVLHNTLNNLVSLIYEDGIIQIQERGRLQSRSFATGLWTFIAGFLELILTILPDNCDHILVEYLPSTKNCCVFLTYDFENFKAQEILTTIKSDEIRSERLRMYQLMCDSWGGSIRFDNDAVSIVLPYQQAT